MLRSLIAPLLPEGLTPEMLGVVDVAHTQRDSVFEAMDPLTALSTKKTAKELERSGKVLLPPQYELIKKAQAELRASYDAKLRGLLERAEKEGPKARARLLAEYEKVALAHLTRSHELGVRVTARGDVANMTDRVWSGYMKERAAHDKLHFADFLSAIWEKREVMKRDDRRSLYTNNLDAMFHQGALAGTRDEISIFWKISPAEHCFDCIGLAANAPYSKPGVKWSNLPPLPTVPRRGDTQCLANCKCFLTFTNSAGKPVDPEDKPGTTAVTKDDEEPSTSRSIEIAEAQKKADQLAEEMQYAKAMFDLTGDKQWLKRRKEANDALIALQDETGLKFIPNAPSGKMTGLVSDATKEGWEAVTASGAKKFTGGQVVGVVHGTEFSTGMLTEWSAKTGRGKMMLLDGRSISVGTADDVPTVMMMRKPDNVPDKEWKVVLPQKVPNAPSPVPHSVPGRGNVIVDAPSAGTAAPANAPAAKAVAESLTKRPQAETHGVTVWLQGEKERAKPLAPDDRRKFGATGVEIVPGKAVVSLRGVSGLPKQEVQERFYAGLGAGIYTRRAVKSPKATALKAALKSSAIVRKRAESFFINGTPEERLFGAAYSLYAVAPEALKSEAEAVYDLVRDVLSEIGSDFVFAD